MRDSSGPLDVGQPEKFEVERLGGGLRIRWRWWSPLYVFLIMFCIAWDGFLVFWYQSAFEDGIDRVEWLFLVFPVAHVGAGIFLTYFTLAGILNSTEVVVQAGQLRIHHGPLPWTGNRVLQTSDLAQLFCLELQDQNDKRQTAYDLMARLRSGTEIKLLHRLTDKREARFLEQEIERAIGISDQAVAGELPK